MTPDDSRLEILQRYAVGATRPEERALLEKALADDPVFRRLMVEYLHVDSALEEFAAASEESPAVAAAVSTATRGTARRWVFAAAAASVAIAWLAWHFRSSQPVDLTAKPVASIPVEVVAVAGLPARPGGGEIRVGDTLQLDTFELAAGRATLRLPTGVRLTVFGPSKIRFRGPLRAAVLRGRVTADVGGGGKGFVIETGWADVVDLGTRFGVEVAATGETGIVVFEGAVEVRETAQAAIGGLIANLKEGQALRFENERHFRRVDCLFVGLDLDDWTTRPGSVPGAVIADVRGNLTGTPAQRLYRVVVGGLNTGAPSRHTRLGRWLPGEGDELPPWLAGADLVETFMVNPRHPGYRLTVTLARPATLYVFYDERHPAPAWLRERFADTGARLRLELADPGIDRPDLPPGKTFAVWKTEVPAAGAVTLDPNEGQESPYPRYTYGLAAKALAAEAGRPR